MSLIEGFIKIPKPIKITFVFGMVFLFIAWQVFFFAYIVPSKLNKPILPYGFCKDCNVILILLDTLRAKSLPCYGYNKNTSPNLCNLAGKSFLFTRTYSQSSYTMDSHFSIMTSLYPISHKMTVPFESVLSDKILTLTQVLRDRDYFTLFFGTTNNHVLPLDKGLGKGLIHSIQAQIPQEWVDSSADYLNKDKKFFATMYTDFLHAPYTPKKENIARFYNGFENAFITKNELCNSAYRKIIKDNPLRFINTSQKQVSTEEECRKLELQLSRSNYFPWNNNKDRLLYLKTRDSIYLNTFSGIETEEKKKYLQALYETSIYELDTELEKFFDYLEKKDLMKNTIVIITSQHGESFQEHGSWEHGDTLYNEAIHIPLIIYVPDSKPQVMEKISESIDIAPTILYLLGIDSPSQFVGLNLFSPQKKEYAISEQFLDRKYSILSKDWKLIINNDNKGGKVTKEFYDMKKDYGEKVNVLDDYPEISSFIEKSLNSILFNQPVYEQKNNQPFPTWVDDKGRKKLIETGYF